MHDIDRAQRHERGKKAVGSKVRRRTVEKEDGHKDALDNTAAGHEQHDGADVQIHCRMLSRGASSVNGVDLPGGPCAKRSRQPSLFLDADKVCP